MAVTDRIFDRFGWHGFPDALFYAAPHALRFDLGGDVPMETAPLRFLRAMDRARAVAELAFAGSGHLTALVRDWGRVAGPGASLRRLGFAERFGRGESVGEGEDERHWFHADFANDTGQIAALIWAAVAAEMPITPKARRIGKIYIADLDHGIVLHAYDDRGMDVIATQPARLQPLYDRYGDWLLEHDRARMDAGFGGG